MTDVTDGTDIQGRDSFGPWRGTQYGAPTASRAFDDDAATDLEERARAFRLVVLRDLT